jgi:3-hydroxyisobutyrate dehydrogenase
VTSNDAGTRVGWIGLGAMGGPMAGCIARAGFDTHAYDIDPTRAQALAADGVHPAASIHEAAIAADALVVMVATPEQVESVLFGDDPAAAALAAGAAVVVMATVGPAPVQRWAERLAQHQVDLVDAPVSGGVARAADGDLLIMVGGADPVVARLQPLLDAMARSAPHVGTAAGDGQKVKLVNQLLCGVHIAAAAEALAFASPPHSPRRPNSSTSPATAPGSAAATTPPSSKCSAAPPRRRPDRPRRGGHLAG